MNSVLWQVQENFDFVVYAVFSCYYGRSDALGSFLQSTQKCHFFFSLYNLHAFLTSFRFFCFSLAPRYQQKLPCPSKFMKQKNLALSLSHSHTGLSRPCLRALIFLSTWRSSVELKNHVQFKTVHVQLKVPENIVTIKSLWHWSFCCKKSGSNQPQG